MYGHKNGDQPSADWRTCLQAPGPLTIPGNLAEASRQHQLMMPANAPPCYRCMGDGTPWLSPCKHEGNEGKGRVGFEGLVS